MLAAVTATSGDLLFTGELVGDFPVLDGRGKQYVAATSGSATFSWGTPPSPAPESNHLAGFLG